MVVIRLRRTIRQHYPQRGQDQLTTMAYHDVTRRTNFSVDTSSWTFQYYQDLKGNVKPYYKAYFT